MDALRACRVSTRDFVAGGGLATPKSEEPFSRGDYLVVDNGVMVLADPSGHGGYERYMALEDIVGDQCLVVGNGVMNKGEIKEK